MPSSPYLAPLCKTRTLQPRIAHSPPRHAEVTDARRAHEHQKLLINELNHRVKNTLATVQAFIIQTLRTAASLPEAREAITARLIALAEAHGVLTAACWEGADLAQIVADGLRIHAGDGHRCTWRGHPVRVIPLEAA
ncbi:HWE histidine kinase domain-containing protein [uncultured Methylobacterium sp.]|uniref:HWE histidine kinase domain-containing protein n=1 Tax=uncultured Methylobacterium sp. TaxID=157278 RepID=UPI0035CC4EA7